MSSSDNTPKDLGPTTSPLFLEKVKEVLSILLGNRGDGNSRALTLRDLQDTGVVGTSVTAKVQAAAASFSSGSITTINTTIEPEVDLTAPPTPTGFIATGALSNLLIECDTQTYTGGHGHFRSVLYGTTWVSGALPTFNNAVVLTQFAGKVFTYATNPSTTWHLWLKWMSKDGVLSSNPAGDSLGGPNGFVVSTGANVDLMVAAMTGAGNPFTVLAVETVIDGVTFPAGTYSTKAFIQDAQITNAKIKNLSVDTAKISELSVSKLTAGTVGAQDMISTGQTVVGGVSVPSWSINGATGLATFNNVTVRGTVYATAGSFTGAVTATSGSFTGAVYASSGSFTGAVYASSGSFNGALVATSISTQSGKFLVSNEGILTAVEGYFSGTIAAGSVDFGSSVGFFIIYDTAGSHAVIVPTVPAGLTRVRIRIKGAGGGGSGGSTRASGRGGGGGQGTLVETVVTVTPGGTLSLVVGTGGTGGGGMDAPYGYAYATAGTATTVSGVATAAGGIRGELIPVRDAEGYTVNDSFFSYWGVNGAGPNGGAGGTASYNGYYASSSGSPGTNASGGGGGVGTDAVYGHNPQPTNGGNGGSGWATFEFFDPTGVVLKAPFDVLKGELRAQGLSIT